jgi:ferric iron reductase protein FhuF
VVGGAIPLSVRPAEGAAEEDPERLAATVAARVLDGPVRELTEATLAFSVSDQVLWGNVASAANGAATMIDSAGPSWAGRAHAIITALLARPPLRGTSTVTGGRFRRRSCCLIYRAAPGAAGPVCGDCVLAPARS